MIKRDYEDFNNKYDRNVDKLYESKPNTALTSNTEETKGDLFSTIVQAYVNDKQIADSWTSKTKQENEASFNLFIRVMGDKPVNQYNRQDFIKFKTTISKLPPRLNKKFKEKSIDDVLATMNSSNKTLSPRSINKRLVQVSSVFGWALLNHYINTNYASDLLIPITSGPQDDKSTYSTEDLQKIISHLPSQDNNKHPERFWIPLIGLFTGARINEICQLHTNDIKLIDGVYCFDINDNSDDKHLKNTTSKRLIAVHPYLLELGLIEYQEQCRIRGDERFWMVLNKGRDGYGQHFGRWYNPQFNRKLITKDPKKTFHSFRHTFIDTLKQAEVSETLISEIAGHKVDSMSMGRYGKKFSKRLVNRTCVWPKPWQKIYQLAPV